MLRKRRNTEISYSLWLRLGMGLPPNVSVTKRLVPRRLRPDLIAGLGVVFCFKGKLFPFAREFYERSLRFAFGIRGSMARFPPQFSLTLGTLLKRKLR